jgi:hypothetical protein
MGLAPVAGRKIDEKNGGRSSFPRPNGHDRCRSRRKRLSSVPPSRHQVLRPLWRNDLEQSPPVRSHLGYPQLPSRQCLSGFAEALWPVVSRRHGNCQPQARGMSPNHARLVALATAARPWASAPGGGRGGRFAGRQDFLITMAEAWHRLAHDLENIERPADCVEAACVERGEKR